MEIPYCSKCNQGKDTQPCNYYIAKGHNLTGLAPLWPFNAAPGNETSSYDKEADTDNKECCIVHNLECLLGLMIICGSTENRTQNSFLGGMYYIHLTMEPG